MTTSPDTPAFSAICLIGASMARNTMAAPVASSPVREVDGLGLLGLGSSLNEGHAAARQQAFLDGGLGVAHGIFDAVLAFLGLDLGGSADLDDSHAASQLGQTLLQLLTVVIGVGVLDLSADLGHASVDVFLGASALTRWWSRPWRR